MCYKHQFYGIESHRCVQMTPTLRCNQRCLFCWRSFEHVFPEETECLPEEIVEAVPHLQKKALSGYKVSPYVTKERFLEALDPKHVAISLSGEPTLYSKLPQLVNLFNEKGYTTFVVSNGTRPWILEECNPFQLYVSLDAPERETYLKVCRPQEDYWEYIMQSLSLLGKKRSAIRITLVRGLNDYMPELYGRMVQDSGATYVEVKGYMFLGYSRKRLTRDRMPPHSHVRSFAEEIAAYTDYEILDENQSSRVVCLGREA
jgi:tRNA wybutosine-synthesizing protein 1